MTRNGIFLSIIAVILAACYLCFFTDWFKKESIQIIPQIRPNRALANPKNPDQDPVYPVPMWHLISDSNSIPVKSIVYGYPIKGMKPAVARSRPEPLAPDVEYVLL